MPTIPNRLADWPMPQFGLGTGTWPSDPAVPQEQFNELVRLVLAQPRPYIDTAALYSLGLSETRLGIALQGVPRESYLLASKAGWDVSQGAPARNNFSRDFILRSVEESMKRLGVSYLDVAHVHDPDNFMQQALDEAFPALCELRDQGVIRAVGSGMNQWQMLAEFARQADVDIFLLAGRYTLLEQTSLPFLELCQQKGITVVLGGVYNSGILVTGPIPGARYNYSPAPAEVVERVRQIEAVCARHGVALPAAAVQFARTHPAVRTLIMGAVTAAEFAGTLAAAETPIPAALWTDLRAEGLLAVEAPIPQAGSPAA